MTARRAARRRQSGAAALLVVMVLFFVMALVAAYSSRSLIFEQRTSANQYRASQAFEAAEAGIDWAIMMLGQGLVDANCRPSSHGANNSFRQRYLAQDGNGVFVSQPALIDLRPTCLLNGGDWVCSCPETGAPVLDVPTAAAPAFTLRFAPDAAITQPGVVRVEATGCSSIGQQCYAASASPADAEAKVSVMLALSSALANPPGAALTARFEVDFNFDSPTLANTDPAGTGLTVISGGSLRNLAEAKLYSRPGTPWLSSYLSNEPSLLGLTSDQMFVSVFGTDPQTYKTQPALVSVSCKGECSVALSQAAFANPGRPLWIEGDLSLNSSVSLGSADAPVVLLVDGNVSVSADLEVHGLVYLRGGQWSTLGGTTLVRGAVIAESKLDIHGAPAINYDAGVLKRINQSHGSMVRVPGGWRDFTAR